MLVKEIRAEQTKPLRHKVLWPHIEKWEDCNIDIDAREDAIHLGAFDAGGKIVGICSLFKTSTAKLPHKKQYRLRAMATDPDVRGSGAGKAIVDQAKEQVKSMGCELLWCDARKAALGFYERMEFDRIDEWYEVRTIGPHQLMYVEFQ
jgi:GNAT superfamily N-acetyltransferase